MQDPNDLVTVAAFRDPWDAHIACGRLRAEDVLAFVTHENHIWMQWSISQAIGGVKVQVPAHAFREASRIIVGLETGEYDGLLEGYESVYTAGPCPCCGSTDFKRVFPTDYLFLLLGLCITISIIFPIYRNRRLCKNCRRISQS